MTKLCSSQALLLLILLAGCEASQLRREERGVDDETIQSIVYQKAKRLGYGLRIFPKVTEFLLGSASQNKLSSSKVASQKASHLANAKRYKRKLNKFQRPPRQAAHVRKPSGKGKAPRVKSNHKRLKNQQKKSKKWSKRYVGQAGYGPAPPPNTFFSSNLPLPLHLPYTASAPVRRPPRPPGSPPSRPLAARPRPAARPPPGPPPGHLPHVKSLPHIRNLEPFFHHEAVAPAHPPPSHQESAKPAPHVDHPPAHPHPIQHAFSPINFNPLHESRQPKLKAFVHTNSLPLPSGPPPRTPGHSQTKLSFYIPSPFIITTAMTIIVI